jgi:hypothetical protein
MDFGDFDDGAGDWQDYLYECLVEGGYIPAQTGDILELGDPENCGAGVGLGINQIVVSPSGRIFVLYDRHTKLSRRYLIPGLQTAAERCVAGVEDYLLF